MLHKLQAPRMARQPVVGQQILVLPHPQLQPAFQVEDLDFLVLGAGRDKVPVDVEAEARVEVLFHAVAGEGMEWERRRVRGMVSGVFGFAS